MNTGSKNLSSLHGNLQVIFSHMTRVMGILNVTPDSFSEKGAYYPFEVAVKRGQQICAEGADILDIGGESTRPAAAEVTVAEEINRVIPVIRALKQLIKIPISIDTCKAEVAAFALDAGAEFINDITGLENQEMQEIAISHQVDVCVMHMQGTPKTMQDNPFYPEGVVEHLLKWFDTRVSLLLQRGIKQERIFLDPGIGFGKTVAHNLQILQNLHLFKAFGFPLLVGLSRKSFLGKILKLKPEGLLPATIAMNTIAIQNGADIIRVHDVQEHRHLANLLSAFDLPITG